MCPFRTLVIFLTALVLFVFGLTVFSLRFLSGKDVDESDGFRVKFEQLRLIYSEVSRRVGLVISKWFIVGVLLVFHADLFFGYSRFSRYIWEKSANLLMLKNV